MLPVEYQMLSKRTAPANMDKRNIALGLIGEGGEVADLIKKFEFHKHPVDKDKLVKEIGDFIWYWARLLDSEGRPIVYGTPSFATWVKESYLKIEDYDVHGIVDCAIKFAGYVGEIAYDISSGDESYLGDRTMAFGLLCKIVHHYDLDMEYIATANVAKLLERFPEGFSTQASIERIDTK